MQKLKDDFDQEQGKDPKNLQRQRAKLTQDLEAKLAELKNSRNQNFLIFGALFGLMTLFSIYICKKGKGAFGNNDEILKGAEFINTEKEKLANLKKKLQEMEKILIAKMTELELAEDVERLNKEEEEANSKIKNLEDTLKGHEEKQSKNNVSEGSEGENGKLKEE